jgi:hypothetical protein
MEKKVISNYKVETIIKASVTLFNIVTLPFNTKSQNQIFLYFKSKYTNCKKRNHGPTDWCEYPAEVLRLGGSVSEVSRLADMLQPIGGATDDGKHSEADKQNKNRVRGGNSKIG